MKSKNLAPLEGAESAINELAPETLQKALISDDYLNAEISVYPSIKSKKSDKIILVRSFLESIKSGIFNKIDFKNRIEEVRIEKQKEIKGEPNNYKELKNNFGLVTTSGIFKSRKSESLIKHSGLICVDIDDNLEAYDSIKNDKYTFALMLSIGGNGLAVLVKINPEKHLESFYFLEKYYLETYNIEIDTSCKDIVRARFVTYDTNLHLNNDSLISEYLETNVIAEEPAAEEKKERKVKKSENNEINIKTIEEYLKEIEEFKIDIAPTYDLYLDVCFAGC